MENKALVSVLMSVYNEKKEWLESSIKSILEQTYENFEFIIINDNPKDKVISEYLKHLKKIDNRILVIQNETNIGLIESLNKGFKYCSGKYIARMDADDISDRERLEKQVQFLENNNEIDLIGTNVSYIDEYGKCIDIKNVFTTGFDNIKKRLRFYNSFNHPTWMFRKKILNDLKGYRRITSAEDYDFIIRLILKGYKCENIDERLLNYRVRSNGISLSNRLLQKTSTRIVSKYYRSNDLSDNIEDELERNIPNKKRNEKYIEIIERLKSYKKNSKSRFLVGIFKFYLFNSDFRNEINYRIFSKLYI